MGALMVTLPWPDKSLWPNRSLGYSFRRRQPAKEVAKSLAYYAAQPHRAAYAGHTQPLAVRWEFCPPTRARRDMNGLYGACKAYEDGLAAGLELDDALFRPVTLDFGPVRKGGAVVVTIGEAR